MPLRNAEAEVCVQEQGFEKLSCPLVASREVRQKQQGSYLVTYNLL